MHTHTHTRARARAHTHTHERLRVLLNTSYPTIRVLQISKIMTITNAFCPNSPTQYVNCTEHEQHIRSTVI